MVQTERLRPQLVVAPQSHRLLLAAVPLASEAQEAAQRAAAAVQSTAAEERAAELLA
jgi:hypothetical protein